MHSMRTIELSVKEFKSLLNIEKGEICRVTLLGDKAYLKVEINEGDLSQTE